MFLQINIRGICLHLDQPVIRKMEDGGKPERSLYNFRCIKGNRCIIQGRGRLLCFIRPDRHGCYIRGSIHPEKFIRYPGRIGLEMEPEPAVVQQGDTTLHRSGLSVRRLFKRNGRIGQLVSLLPEGGGYPERTLSLLNKAPSFSGTEQ